jgi:hypothetical protein
MSGFADGTFVTVERTTDTFSKTTGTDGFTSRAKSNDKSGSIKLTFAQTSPSNDILQGFALADEISNAGVVPVLVKDIGGRTVFVSAFGWIKKPPSVEFGKEISNREWDLDLADLQVFVGGNADIE